jgi:hypothetical protein
MRINLSILGGNNKSKLKTELLHRWMKDLELNVPFPPLPQLDDIKSISPYSSELESATSDESNTDSNYKVFYFILIEKNAK